MTTDTSVTTVCSDSRSATRSGHSIVTL
jgi:hypothetical protein